LAGVMVGSALNPARSSSIVVTSIVQFWNKVTRSTAGADVSHTLFNCGCCVHVGTESVHFICPVRSRTAQTGARSIRRPLTFTRRQTARNSQDKPYPFASEGFRVHETVAVKPQSGRPNGRADVRSHGQSVSSPRARSIRDRSHVHSHSAFTPRPRFVRVREQSATMFSPRPRSRREPTASRYLDWPENVRATVSHFPCDVPANGCDISSVNP
jgi:hypothetical protein